MSDEPREMKAVPWKPKHCGCGRVHETIEAWRELPPAAGGLHYSDAYEISEYRNCPCGSTIVVALFTSEDDSESEVA